VPPKIGSAAGASAPADARPAAPPQDWPASIAQVVRAALADGAVRIADRDGWLLLVRPDGRRTVVTPHTAAQLAAAGLLPPLPGAVGETGGDDPDADAERAAIQAEPPLPPEGSAERARGRSACGGGAGAARGGDGAAVVLRGRGAQAATEGSLLLGVQGPPVLVPQAAGDGRHRALAALALRRVQTAGPSGAGRSGGGADMNDDADAPPATPALARLSTADAEWFDALAAEKRAAAASAADPVWAAQQAAEGEGLAALAAALRDPSARGVPALRRGRGGEAAPTPHSDMPGRCRDVADAVAREPALLAAEASLDRLGLARTADALALAVETAEDARAETAAEKMIAHQLAAAHKLAMELIAAASRDARRHTAAPHLNQGALAEAARTGAAAARLMVACQGAALALDRLRHGARQQIVVQHVAVADGGQAVVAGSVAMRGATRKEGEGAR
jgi:hypothetical protein